MADIVSFNGAVAEPLGDPQADVIEILEDLLASAKAGQVQGFAYTAVYLGGDIDENWGGGSSIFTMLGAIHLLARSFTDAVIVNRDD